MKSVKTKSIIKEDFTLKAKLELLSLLLVGSYWFVVQRQQTMSLALETSFN